MADAHTTNPFVVITERPGELPNFIGRVAHGARWSHRSILIERVSDLEATFTLNRSEAEAVAAFEQRHHQAEVEIRAVTDLNPQALKARYERAAADMRNKKRRQRIDAGYGRRTARAAARREAENLFKKDAPVVVVKKRRKLRTASARA